MKRHSLVTANHMLRVGHITRAIVSRLYLDALIHVDSSRKEERRAAHGVGLIHELAAIITAGKLTNSKALLLKQVAGGNRVGLGRPQLDWARMLVDCNAPSVKQVAGGNRVGRIKGEMILDQIATILQHADVVGLAGIGHDIGKIVVPKRILAKPAALTRREYELVQQHPSAGIELVPREWVEGLQAGEASRSRGIEFGVLAALVAGTHHAGIDGEGNGVGYGRDDLLKNCNNVQRVAHDAVLCADTIDAALSRKYGLTPNGQRTRSLTLREILMELGEERRIGLYLREYLAGMNVLHMQLQTAPSLVWPGQLN